MCATNGKMLLPLSRIMLFYIGKKRIIKKIYRIWQLN